MNSKEYKQSLGKMVKDMTDEERKKYGQLRTKESRAKKKALEPPKEKKEKATKNVPNKKLKCFMLTAKNGKPYRTCATPEKDKKPKKQVRDNPRPADNRVKPVVKAYGSPEERKKGQQERAKKKKEDAKKPKKKIIIKKVKKEEEKPKKKIIIKKVKKDNAKQPEEKPKKKIIIRKKK